MTQKQVSGVRPLALSHGRHDVPANIAVNERNPLVSIDHAPG